MNSSAEKLFSFSRFYYFSMKTSSFFLILFITKVLSCDKENENSIAYAINGILNGYFALHSPKVDLIVYGLFQKSEKIVEKLLTIKNDAVSIKILTGSLNNRWKNKLNISSILLFDSRQNFKEFYNNITWQDGKGSSFKHLVYYPNSAILDFAQIRDGFLIDNVNFLYCVKKQPIFLIQSYMFTPAWCRRLEFHSFNNFNVRTKKWKNSVFYPQKYLNFYDCNLRTIAQGSEALAITSFKILEAFAKSRNARISVRKVSKNVKVKPEDFDFHATAAAISVDNNGTVISHPFIIDYWIFFIPPGELYTPLEKMFLPFHEDVWIAVIVTLSIGIVVTKCIELTSKNLRMFMFGNNISTPTVNFVATFLNGVQAKVPNRNFARFCLMLFIGWCLVIRTCYQSELYKHLQSDKRKPEVKAIEEMIRKNFTFYDSGYLMGTINEIAAKNGLKK